MVQEICHSEDKNVEDPGKQVSLMSAQSSHHSYLAKPRSTLSTNVQCHMPLLTKLGQQGRYGAARHILREDVERSVSSFRTLQPQRTWSLPNLQPRHNSMY